MTTKGFLPAEDGTIQLLPAGVRAIAEEAGVELPPDRRCNRGPGQGERVRCRRADRNDLRMQGQGRSGEVRPRGTLR